MRRSLALLLALPVLAAAIPAASFTGSWAGPWDDPSLSQNGTAAITVDAAGNVAGTVFNAQINLTGPVAGRIEPNGTTRLTYSYPGTPGTMGAEGTCTAAPPGFICLFGFVMPDGQRIGRGTFHFLPAASPAPASKG